MKAEMRMGKKLRGIFLALGIGLMAFAVAFPAPAWAQDRPADNRQILRKMAFQGHGHILRLHPLFCGQRIAESPGRGSDRHFISAEISRAGRLCPTTEDIRKVMMGDS